MVSGFLIVFAGSIYGGAATAAGIWLTNLFLQRLVYCTLSWRINQMLDAAVLFATILILSLYGAGLRRPFGSLATVRSLPGRLRYSPLIPWIDWLFVVFIISMLVLLAWHLPLWSFLLAGIITHVFAEWLATRITIVPSFWLAGALALFSLSWVVHKFCSSI
jgi:hypothetical protein